MSFVGKKNLYLCTKCGHGFVTIDKDEGTTPFITRCLDCDGQAQSLCYGVPQETLRNIPAALEWYYPKPPEVAALSGNLAGAIRVHISMGGLLLRPVTAVEGG